MTYDHWKTTPDEERFSSAEDHIGSAWLEGADAHEQAIGELTDILDDMAQRDEVDPVLWLLRRAEDLPHYNHEDDHARALAKELGEYIRHIGSDRILRRKS